MRKYNVLMPGPKIKQQVFARDNGICQYCGRLTYPHRTEFKTETGRLILEDPYADAGKGRGVKYRLPWRDRPFAYFYEDEPDVYIDIDDLKLERVTGPYRDIDHIYPRWANGSNDLDNLVTACSQCNAKAGPRIFADFQTKRTFIRHQRHIECCCQVTEAPLSIGDGTWKRHDPRCEICLNYQSRPVFKTRVRTDDPCPGGQEVTT